MKNGQATKQTKIHKAKTESFVQDNNNLLQEDDIKGKTHKSFGLKKKNPYKAVLMRFRQI